MSRTDHTRRTIARPFRLGIAASMAMLLSVALLPAMPAAAAPGAWQDLADAPFARQEASYVNLDGKLHLVGTVKTHHVYDPATDTWSTKAPMLVKVDHVQAVATGGKIYVVGGLQSWPDGDVGNVQIYDPGTNTWSEGTAMPAARTRGAGAVVVRNGDIYYAGGLHGGTTVAMFDVYDPDTDTWTALPDMPRAREHFHAAIAGGKLWAVGGRQGAINSTLAETDAFNFTSNEWETGFAEIPTERGGFGVGVSGDRVIVFGGEGGGIHPEVEAYDVSDDAWSTFTSMPIPRHGIQVAECGGAFYIATGGTAQGGGSATVAQDVFRLDPGDGCGTPPPPGCTGEDTEALDEDEDGFSNADEIDNGTDPCDDASTPPDNDGDDVSDLNDPDDDDDGKPDLTDAFAIDASNGTTTAVPVSLTWETPESGLADTGFTGLMVNGSANYLNQFNTDKLATGGGELTIDGVPAGDAFKKLNSQRFGFQLGVMPAAGKFTASTRIVAPFDGVTPQESQSMGLFVGNGSQSNYVKLAVQGTAGGRINLIKEKKDAIQAKFNKPLAMPGPDYVDLFLTIDPVSGTIKASFVATVGGVAGPRIKLSKPIAIPSKWYDGSKALAVGIISTSRGIAPQFTAGWDSLAVVGGAG